MVEPASVRDHAGVRADGGPDARAGVQVEPPVRLAVGDVAPGFDMPTGTGDVVRLSWMMGQLVVLYFYRSDTDDTCVDWAMRFRDRHDEIRELDAHLYGVSKDGHVSHEKLKREHGLPFPLLIDHDHRVAKRYGAWGERTQYGRTFDGVLRSHFVIGRDGKLMDAAYNVLPEDSVKRVMEVLRGAD